MQICDHLAGGLQLARHLDDTQRHLLLLLNLSNNCVSFSNKVGARVVPMGEMRKPSNTSTTSARRIMIRGEVGWWQFLPLSTVSESASQGSRGDHSGGDHLKTRLALDKQVQVFSMDLGDLMR